MVEIARKVFVSLNYDKRTGMYYVLCDGNCRTKFYSDNDADAKRKFNEYLNNN